MAGKFSKIISKKIDFKFFYNLVHEKYFKKVPRLSIENIEEFMAY